MTYKLVIIRGYSEFHFLFKKIQEASDFAEEFMNHMVSCGDPDDDAKEVKFTIYILKKDASTKEEEN